MPDVRTPLRIQNATDFAHALVLADVGKALVAKTDLSGFELASLDGRNAATLEGHAAAYFLPAADFNPAAFDAAGAVTDGINAHVALADPHTQYALESALGTMATQAEANYLLATGARTGATSQRQLFQLGLSAGKAGFSGSFFDGIDTDGNIGVQIRGSLNLHNTYIGASSGAANTTGGENVFVGGNAGLSNIDGAINVFVGYNAGRNNTSGSYNVFVGNGAGRNTTTGTANVFIGVSAGNANTTGSQLIFLGSNAGLANTTGVRNLFLGDSAGRVTTTGNYNVFFGADAGRLNTTGSENTAIGTDAGRSNVTGNGNTFLGFSTGYNETGSNTLYIANSATATPLIYGNFATGLLTVHTADAVTNAIVNTLTLNHLSSGTPAAGYGVALRAQLESSTTESQDAGRLTWQWDVATHASRASKGQLTAFYTSTERPAMTWGADASGPLLGFGAVTTPIAIPVLPTGAAHTTEDIIAHLQSLGLARQS